MKSGMMSCCGRGGSWFGNCGSTGDTHLGHTWSEGLQACKARSQFQADIDQQLSGAEQDRSDASEHVSNASSEVVISTSRLLLFTSVAMSVTAPIITPAYPPSSTPTHAAIAIRPKLLSAAHAAIAIRPKLLSTKAIISTSSNMSTPSSIMVGADTSIVTSTRATTGHNVHKESMVIPVKVSATSRGFEQPLQCVTVLFSSLLTILVFQFAPEERDR